jgi:hypothetical protein
MLDARPGSDTRRSTRTVTANTAVNRLERAAVPPMRLRGAIYAAVIRLD